MKDKVFYLCDGNVPECTKEHCYKQTDDDPCRHTSDISHAINYRLECLLESDNSTAA